MAQPHRKGQTDVRTDRNLVDALELILHRFLDGDDSLGDRVDGREKGVKGRRFARSGGPGHQDDAVRLDDELADQRVFLRGKPQLLEAEEDLAAQQQTQGNRFAPHRRHRGHADVDFLALDADIDAAVLRQALLGDVHPGHHLDA